MPKENDKEWASVKEAFNAIKNETISWESFSTDKVKSLLYNKFTTYLSQLTKDDQSLLLGSLWKYKKDNGIENSFIDLWNDL